jgi:hypothetical protein
MLIVSEYTAVSENVIKSWEEQGLNTAYLEPTLPLVIDVKEFS